MKTLYKYFFIFLCSTLFVACNEEEIKPFSSERGINFLAPNGYGGFTDNFNQLSTDINFYTYYVTKGLDIKELPLQLGVQLEGEISNTPINIRLKAIEKEDYELADIIIPTDSAIEAGKYQRGITITCQKPQVFDKEFGAVITFDYENSDVVPGTKERQNYQITLKDATIWEDMEVSNENEWNESYSSTLGVYGPIKVRFILATLGKLEYSYNAIKNLYYYTTSYPNYGFKKVMDQLKTALEEYNNTHDEPLCEPDGTLVTFN